MSTKKYFDIFSQSWPKGGAARPVRGERGIHDLPSGEERGENIAVKLERLMKADVQKEATT